ncbi:rRNA maturation RNase YbeY [Limibaculum sp. M0105]|uniref:Endoribonuclease YbeY n=1 Tax=Thermohalobaculum xanthum TaxID=2753746 RepID=A0A8J7SGH5_9RHOB|nr:rRNA maturation RNase YbeY [Thermohalobaculum xanthum]MBK0400906.1 rRNA maturation RNase YbeY [Thermohalobaculum xanthum]
MSAGDGAPRRLVDLVIEEEGWLDAVPDIEALAERAARMALDGAGIAADCYEIALLACNDDRIAALNADFRGKPKPTNVLSWPAFDLAPGTAGATPAAPPAGRPDAPVALGDVAIALQTMRREAEDASIPLKDHAIHLILHGCLHLLGFDHESEQDAALMEGIERRQLVAAGIADPYSEGDAAQPPVS